MQEINKMEELKNCTFVKTVLMVVIVILHSVAFWRGDWFTIIQPGQDFAPFKLLAEWIATFPVYGFALVSGYLFYYVKYEREGYTQFGSFLKKKFNRLLVPYIFISAVWAVPIGCFFFHYNRKDIINDYILGKSPNQLWFLLMLFWALLFMFFLSDVIKKNVVFAIGVAAVFYVLSIAVRHFGGGYFQISTGCAYVPFLITGFMIRQYQPKLLTRIPAFAWVIVDLVLFFISRTIQPQNGRLYLMIGMGVSLLLHIWGAMMAFYVLEHLADKINWCGSAVFRLEAKYSMVIYMLHQQVIYFVLYYLNGKLAPLWIGMIAFIVAITVSSLIASVCMKFKVTRLLIGEITR